jgi:hypothetical protein
VRSIRTPRSAGDPRARLAHAHVIEKVPSSCDVEHWVSASAPFRRMWSSACRTVQPRVTVRRHETSDALGWITRDDLRLPALLRPQRAAWPPRARELVEELGPIIRPISLRLAGCCCASAPPALRAGYANTLRRGRRKATARTDGSRAHEQVRHSDPSTRAGPRRECAGHSMSVISGSNHRRSDQCSRRS